MKKDYNKEEAFKKKKSSIRKINEMFESLIKSGDTHDLKKVYMISKWLENYANYILFEPKFVPQRNIAYKRGNIIQVNFGFRLGAELGGVHYAVVIDKDNKRSSNTITVIPMSSLKDGKKIHNNDCNIGNEFYNMMHARVKNLIAQTEKEHEEIQTMIETFSELLDSTSQIESNSNIIASKDKLIQLIENANQKNEELKTHKELLLSTNKELGYMKEGSIVKIGQIVTISKLRIIKPKKTADVLSGISLSENTMKKINEKMKELFIFEE